MLERIIQLQDETHRSHLTQAEILTQSIVQHLQRILNTKRGSVPIDAEFGVPDFTNLAGSFATGQTTQMIENMTRMIARYEPRLKSPRILVAESSQEVLSLSFSLEGLVAINDRDIPIHLATRVSSDGRVSLAMH
ncbi:type VI secretion protein [Pseudomonas sp. Leaf127]|uniref:type VI secretion system baseplate subunit TssE n=1 Tax=Pseudomonas sp. Leaf127 TaxID=1736267 RepID=UPI0007024B39|nr:type VI secretion system baseplate subunit TssE [Pseudomonas sp. Leaf127]KQQ49865.1 type VI secretion protein [Pseudomonas sp. Leaf127]